MRGAVESRAQGARLILQPIEHIVDGDRERIELVVGPGNRQPATQLTREDPFAGAGNIPYTARHPVTEPESGKCRRKRCQADTPEHGDPEFLGEAPPLRDIGSHQQVIATGQCAYRRSDRVNRAPAWLDSGDLEL